MRTDYRVLHPDGRLHAGVVDWPAEPGIGQILQLVTPLLDGGHLERVRVLYEDAATDMFVDEDRIAKGLPVNPAASAIYRAASLRRNPTQNPDELPAVWGPAVLFLRRVWF